MFRVDSTKALAFLAIFSFVAQTGLVMAQPGDTSNRLLALGEVAAQDFERAKTLFQIGEVGAAASTLEMLIDSYPDSSIVFESTLFLGEIYLGQNQPLKAKRVAEKFLSTHTDERQVKAVKELMVKADAKKPAEIKAQAPPIATRATVPLAPSQMVGPPTPAPATIAPLPVPMPAPEPSYPTKPSVLGVILPLSGQYAAYGERALIAVQMALGLPLVKFKGPEVLTQPKDNLTLVVADSKGVVNVASSMVELLVKEQGAIAILGDVLVDTSLAVAKKSQELGVANLSLSRRPGLVEVGSFVFRLGLTTQKQTRALAERASGQLGITKYAVVYPKHPYGTEMKDSFIKEVKAKGGEITTVLSYDPNETNFADLANRLIGPQNYGANAAYKKCMEDAKTVSESFRSKKVVEACKNLVAPHVSFHALFLPDFPKPLSYLLPTLISKDVLVTKNERLVNSFRKSKQMPNLRPVQLLGPSSWGGPLLGERLGNQIDGAAFVDGVDFTSTNERMPAFVTEFKRVANGEPTVVEAQAYDAASILRSLIAAQPVDAPKTRGELATKLLTVRNFKGLTGDISFDQSRDSVVPLHWFVFQDSQVRSQP